MKIDQTETRNEWHIHAAIMEVIYLLHPPFLLLCGYTMHCLLYSNVSNVVRQSCCLYDPIKSGR
jgi:hypothetical protein